MKRKAAKPSQAPKLNSSLKTLQQKGSLLGEPWPEYREPQGGSPFKVALSRATTDQVRRAADIAGSPDAASWVEYFRKTQNPIWLWLALSISPNQAELPPEVFTYLKGVARQFFNAVIAEVSAFDRVQILPGKELDEGVVRKRSPPPKRPSILAILGLSRPGKNYIQSAAKDFRAISMATARESLVRKGISREDANAFVAQALGYGSADAGPSTVRIKQIVAHGRKLIVAGRKARR